MKPNKTNVKKILRILEKTNKKVFTCDNLSKETGFDQEAIFGYVEYFYSIIRLDPNHNLKEFIPNLKEFIEKEDNKALESGAHKEKRISHREYKEYNGFIDYISRVMTTGGILDMGYQITPKDKKILMYLLKNEISKKK